ncbi:MAG TPA: tRNA (adenosine(37)-N6)-threonylcarbamoyltransferase complex transferase subunit TsaD [Methylomirabilota bacterium]|nr:tRNA (adenosine(37)-N6)-threonylcarbamoyltransferase complex transferase subunit TsaD [Methylomirabilota bacterium]
MLVLGIESSCDETSAAVLADGEKIRSNIVASQDAIHAPYGGVVPELASRRHVEVIVPTIRKALNDAGVSLAEVNGVAVTQGPGLIGSLLVGVSIAKALAYAQKIPLVGVNHLEGHIFAGSLQEPKPTYPFLALVVSGGHTALYFAREPQRYRLIGQTRDDAAGEAFDKVAKLLGLGYPGGPAIQKISTEGDPTSIPFPLAQITDGAPDFSFSGIKTAVSLFARKHQPLSPQLVRDVAASFQATVVKMLVRKTIKAALRLGVRSLLLTGGVAANTPLREALAAEASERGWGLSIPPISLCTDNAAMIAAAGYPRLVRGERADLAMNGIPDLRLA